MAALLEVRLDTNRRWSTDERLSLKQLITFPATTFLTRLDKTNESWTARRTAPPVVHETGAHFDSRTGNYGYAVQT